MRNINKSAKMRKYLFTILLALASMMIMAQESFNESYRLAVGDTLVWQPFAQCNKINYKVSSKEIVSFEPIHYGEKTQVIGLTAGICTLKATCGDLSVIAEVTVFDNVQNLINEVHLEKPNTLPFTGTYRFTPPSDHYFITFTNPDDEARETYAKIGSEEAHNKGTEIDRFWNIETGANYYYVPDAQGWTDDVKWDFEPFGESFFPLNCFAREVDTEKDLSPYYTGMDQVLDIDCWTFFVELGDGNVIRYWVDPSNGCTLKRIVNNNNPSEVTVYDLNYTKWFFGPRYKKSLHDKTR